MSESTSNQALSLENVRRILPHEDHQGTLLLDDKRLEQAAIELGRSVEDKVGQPTPGSDTSQNAGNLTF
jgi:hypothetical protein